jgi:hypothetical protein
MAGIRAPAESLAPRAAVADELRGAGDEKVPGSPTAAAFVDGDMHGPQKDPLPAPGAAPIRRGAGQSARGGT